MRIFQVLSVACVGVVAFAQQQHQHQQAQQSSNNQQSAAQQAATQRLLSPAAVHFVNIGEKLEGDYKFGYDTGKSNEAGQSFREESRLPDGTVKGAYGFIDASGKQRIIRYTAGKDGFKAEGDIYQDGAPANTPGLNGAAPQPVAAAAPRAAPQQQYQAPQQQYQAPQPQYQAPQPQYQAPRPQPQYQAPQYQAPQQQYQAPQYRPQQSAPAAPQYGPQSIQYQPQSQSQYPQYPTYATNQNQYASASQVSGGYRQPSQGLYASAQTNVPSRVEPAFPDFFKQSQAAPQQYRAQPQAAPQYQAPQQQYQPQQYQAPRQQQQYQPQQYQSQPQQQYQAPKPAAAPAFTPVQSTGGKKKIEDGQYDPELTKAGLYYPDLYEKISIDANKKQ